EGRPPGASSAIAGRYFESHERTSKSRTVEVTPDKADHLRGAIAAAVTPLLAGGDAVDIEAIPPLVEHLAVGGIDGILAMGTTGEGILLDVAERRAVARAFVDSGRNRLTVMVHCGAQTTNATALLAAHAAEIGAAAVAVIGPPYYEPDDLALAAHFTEAARACAPLPFFIYELAARAGYALKPSLIEELRLRIPNLVGLKVSDTPWEKFEPYLLEGLRIFVGPEALIHRGMERGAVGAVSGLAAAFPEAVSAVVRHPTTEGAARLGEIRSTMNRFPFQAALKRILVHRGAPINEACRRPLRALTQAESTELDHLAPGLLATEGANAR
ncbi:MAG: dihydrodipicolinate synthase family protein, partial [Candidatus Dormibacteraeota bacterium]|nr:dihydrodipicolinate synthase family protein [Candidatus Dormibacteraeota bacterium]